MPNLMKVPGVVSVIRLKAEPFAISIGGEPRSVAVGGEPADTAIYEIESPDVLASKEWAAAVELARGGPPRHHEPPAHPPEGDRAERSEL